MTTPQRPTRYDDATHIKAAQLFLKHIGMPENNDEDLVSIGKALSEPKAFTRATELSDLAFDMTDDLLLDVLNHDFCDLALDQQIRSWVLNARVKARQKIGDVVSFEHKGSKVDGEIINIDPTAAKYTIYVESLGHVKAGVGTLGLIVQFETIHELSRPADEFELEMAI